MGWMPSSCMSFCKLVWIMVMPCLSSAWGVLLMSVDARSKSSRVSRNLLSVLAVVVVWR